MEKKYMGYQLGKFKGDPIFTQIVSKPLAKNELLVKIMCATMHPADFALGQGTYGLRPSKFPIVPGLEGSGQIEEVGEEIDKSLIGKRASIGSKIREDGGFEGVWAEYKVCIMEELMIYDFDLDEKRTGLDVKGQLKDLIADDFEELSNVAFANGFGRITDIDIGPDGFLYILSTKKHMTNIYRISPR